jgi:acetyl esterase/lipase
MPAEPYNEVVRSAAIAVLFTSILPVAAEISGDVLVHRNIAYIAGASKKQHLDLYIPRGQAGFPVAMFVYGGSWRIGDRSWYRGVGQRLAQAGIGVAIPSYRAMGLARNAHPAQIGDVAAAFAWVHSHIAEYGGDASRLYVAGHSAGGHLASLLALDPQYLRRHKLETSSIRGVISISGVYSVDRLAFFHAQGKRSDASPIQHVHSGAPRFLIAYCTFDYPALAPQAREFRSALERAGVSSELVRLSGDNHLTEVFGLAREESPLLGAVLRFIQ